MSHRLSLRALFVATAAVGAAIVPAAGAFAESSPTPVPPRVERKTVSPSDGGAKPSDGVVKERADLARGSGEGVRVIPRGGVAAGDKPSPARERAAKVVRLGDAAVPRGGVAAGERPTEGSTAGTGNTAAVVGSAAGFALLAGVGTVVIRRRAAVRHHA
ncbi:hypothetical protein ACWF94_13970 [Streptomyces sp. NPDC055078]